MPIHWDEPHNEEGDQNGDSNLVGHGYWSLGTNHGPDDWGIELIAQDEHLEEADGGVHLGYYPSAEAARAAAQEYEDAHGGRSYEQLHANCTHPNER